MLRVPWNTLTCVARHRRDRLCDAGDIIKADAETFDPDNKIIWRLHADTPVGEKGNWMYAPVRGPKTAVPLNEALLKRVEEGVKFYKVNGKKEKEARLADVLNTVTVGQVRTPPAYLCMCSTL